MSRGRSAALWWIRRDLRLLDNPALQAGCAEGSVVPVFILDPQLLAGYPNGVVFEVDSLGGELAGAFETADLIARLSAEKPTLMPYRPAICSRPPPGGSSFPSTGVPVRSAW